MLPDLCPPQWLERITLCSYEESAAMFAKTQNPFEEVALKFIRLPDKEPLQTFVMEKLNSLKPQVSRPRFETLQYSIALTFSLRSASQDALSDLVDHHEARPGMRKSSGSLFFYLV